MDLSKVEVFKVAQKMEEQGIDFYEKAAEFAEDDTYRVIFKSLSDMEKAHLKTFIEMEKKYNNDVYSDSDEIKNYLSENISATLFETDDSEKEWSEIKKMLDIFKLARSKEAHTVIFYALIKDHVKDAQAKAALQEVINEEKEHVALMEKYIAELS